MSRHRKIALFLLAGAGFLLALLAALFLLAPRLVNTTAVKERVLALLERETGGRLSYARADVTLFPRDTTLLEDGGRTWLFANLKEQGGSSLNALHLFWAEDPLSRTWHPHPANPVVRDISSARPAGRIFMHDGDLIRPSQDSSRRYGGALKFNRILRLDAEAYSEEPIAGFSPTGGKIRATHTFNQAGRMPASCIAKWVFAPQPPRVAYLAGSVTDDGLPTGADLTATWSMVAGPGQTSFANSNSPVTTATFGEDPVQRSGARKRLRVVHRVPPHGRSPLLPIPGL